MLREEGTNICHADLNSSTTHNNKTCRRDLQEDPMPNRISNTTMGSLCNSLLMSFSQFLDIVFTWVALSLILDLRKYYVSFHPLRIASDKRSSIGVRE